MSSESKIKLEEARKIAFDAVEKCNKAVRDSRIKACEDMAKRARDKIDRKS